MLAGKANSLDMRVFKAEHVSKLWGEYPVMFRLFLLPVVLATVVHHRMRQTEFAFVVLGKTGETIDLMNDHLILGPDSESGDAEAVAYAAESVLYMRPAVSRLKTHVMTTLALAQTIVWCVQGQNVKLIVTGESGGELPEWGWEAVQKGPHITNIRIKNFDEPQLPDE